MTVNESVGAVVKCHFSWLSRDGVRSSLYHLQKRVATLLVNVSARCSGLS